MSEPLKTVLFSTLYPSSVRPVHGIFVETRLRELLKTGQVETRVVAPVPWFPSENPRYGHYALFAKTPRRESWHGIEVEHPRYLLPPKIGQNIAPYVLALGALPTLRRMIREGFDFDLIDAHFFYPDGVAAALLARWLNKPFVCTARGSDINLYRQFRIARWALQRTLRKSAGNIGVSADLVKQMQELGAPAGTCHVMRNGVDLQRFEVLDRPAARQALGLAPDGRWLVSVGHLVELKGHHLAIGLLAELPWARLAIVGGGVEMERLRALADQLGVADRVVFAGQRPQEELKLWFNAAEALILASSREGWANVLLEALACGTPVVATRVSGTPEVIADPVAGQLATERSLAGLKAALTRLMDAYPDRSAVRRYAEGFSWDETSQAQVRLFDAVRAAR